MKIYKVTNAQLKALLEKGSITVGGTTYTYNSEDVYVVTDGFPEYRLSEGVAKNIVQLTKDGVVVATATVNNVEFATTSNKAQMLVSKGATSTEDIYETANSIRQKTVAPLVTANTVLTADLAANIVAVGYFETGTAPANERWYVMIDTTKNEENPGLEAFRWDSYDTLDIYTVSWDLGTKWSAAEIINNTLATSANITDLNTKVNNKLDKISTTGDLRVYMISSTGINTTLSVASNNQASAIIQRDNAGKAQVATPTDADNKLTIATKEYVDNHSSGLTLTDNEDGTVTLNIV